MGSNPVRSTTYLVFKMKKIICLGLALISIKAFAYTQSDLLSAQTNFQTAKSNLDTNKSQLTEAKDNLTRAESAVQNAKKSLADAEKNLKSKQESAVVAKRNVNTANAVYNQSGLTVENVWQQINGKPKGSTP